MLMKWIRRIVLGVVGVVALLVLGVVGVVVADATFGAQATDYTNVTYSAADGTELHGYLARPADESQTYPAVLMVHEWWGINGEITELADELASEGYVVLAPDTYRGETTSLVPRALVLRLSVPMQRVNSDMQASYEYLTSLDGVSDSVGVIGFCYGGEVALNHGSENTAIAATINLYGSTPADSDAFGALTDDDAALLGIFGADDGMIPLEEVNAFDAALDDAGVTHTVSIYEGVGHAFVQPDTIAEAGAAQDAWEEILTFFETHLHSDTSDNA